jgi:hypothetical protein
MSDCALCDLRAVVEDFREGSVCVEKRRGSWGIYMKDVLKLVSNLWGTAGLTMSQANKGDGVAHSSLGSKQLT